MFSSSESKIAALEARVTELENGQRLSSERSGNIEEALREFVTTFQGNNNTNTAEAELAQKFRDRGFPID